MSQKDEFPRGDTVNAGLYVVLDARVVEIGEPERRQSNVCIVVEGVRCIQAPRVHVNGLLEKHISTLVELRKPFLVLVEQFLCFLQLAFSICPFLCTFHRLLVARFTSLHFLRLSLDIDSPFHCFGNLGGSVILPVGEHCALVIHRCLQRLRICQSGRR